MASARTFLEEREHRNSSCMARIVAAVDSSIATALKAATSFHTESPHSRGSARLRNREDAIATWLNGGRVPPSVINAAIIGHAPALLSGVFRVQEFLMEQRRYAHPDYFEQVSFRMAVENVVTSFIVITAIVMVVSFDFGIIVEHSLD